MYVITVFRITVLGIDSFIIFLAFLYFALNQRNFVSRIFESGNAAIMLLIFLRSEPCEISLILS